VTIYFIRAVDCGRIKIGYTDAPTPDARLNGMRTGCPSELEILAFCPGPQEREQELHSILGRDNVRGEWFKPTKRVLSLVGYAKQFGTTDGWFTDLDPLKVALKRGGVRERHVAELDSIWSLVLKEPPEERRCLREGQSFEEIIARHWAPIAISSKLAVVHQCSGRAFGFCVETSWVDRFTDRPADVSRGATATAAEIAAADHNDLAVAAIWIQAALRHCLGRRQDLITGQIPEAPWLAREAERIHAVDYHAKVTETLPMDIGIPFRSVVSAAEFVTQVALVQAATSARFAIVADYTVGAYEPIESTRAA
jgi:hypothetical protein